MSESTRDPQIDKAIELYACFGTPASVFKTMHKEFGEHCLTAYAIRKIRESHRNEILEKRKNLEASIPLLDPTERWARLQEIVDGALEGDEIFTKTGSYLRVDRTAALNALKLAHEFTSTKGTVNPEDDDLVKSIVMDAYEELKREKPEASEEEIIKEIEETLGDKVTPFLDDIRKENSLYVSGTTEG
jgi:hypothetical protein